MKNNQSIGFLIAVLFVTSGLSAWLALSYHSAFRARQELAPKAANARTARGLISAIGNDAYEYGKTHPAIQPILKAYLVQSSAPSAKPAAK